jgi:hypothetical protein
MEFLKLVGIIILGVGLLVGGWMIKRTINYSFDYEDKVIKTVEKKYEQRIIRLEQSIKVLEEYSHG